MHDAHPPQQPARAPAAPSRHRSSDRSWHRVWSPSFLRSALTRLVAATLVALGGPFLADARAQADQTRPAVAEKLTVGVPRATVLDAVRDRTKSRGQAGELAQILEGFDAKLETALHATRKFEVLAHVELDRILREQGVQDSGNYDLDDPKRAQAFKLKGIPYLAVVQFDDFQDQVQRANFEGIGQQATRRQIRLGATCRIYDTTTGALKESARLTLSDLDFKNNPDYVVDQQGGDLTEAVIGAIADRMADQCAARIADILFPAKVVAVRDGFATINRGEGGGIAVGEVWEAFATGEELIDPDTGESLGAEEVAVGFVRVVSVAPKTARAEICGGDRGIARGCVMRRTDRKECPEPPSIGGSARMVMPSAEMPEDRAPVGGAATGTRRAAAPAGSSRVADEPPAGTSDAPTTAAIFIRNRSPKVDDAMVAVLEDFVVAGLDGSCFTTISREDTLAALSSFASKGANAGSRAPEGKDLDRLLSDDASALSLAQAMGADFVLVASITGLSVDRRTLRDAERGLETEVERQRLDVTYRLLGRAKGAVVAAGSASAADSVRQQANLRVERDLAQDLVRESAAKLCAVMKARCARAPLPAPETLEMVSLQIVGAMSDLAIPEIVRGEDGEWTVASGSYVLEPTSFVVEIDGVVAGTTPAPIVAPRGLHRIRVTRPDFETYEATVNLAPDRPALVIPMKLTAAGLARVKEMSAFFNDLKREQRLTDAQTAVLEGYAEMLRNSKVSIDRKSDIKSDVKVETSEAPVFQERSFWPAYLREE
jgi:curli biogenesis system outer membrane secretion channel CsgG